ncbi:MAG: amidohydrolase [Bacteroidetes bacterium]|nr:amidohydrolase [Bacteroidota bacterium]
MMRFAFVLAAALLWAGCGRSLKKADLIVYNAKVYTMDGGLAVLESFAVKDGRITAVGTNESIAAVFESDSMLDAQGKVILPGLIDAHAHFTGYGLGLQECDLVGTTSFADVLQRVKTYSATSRREWIIGRGWDQNDWPSKTYPDRAQLDSLFPRTPVLLQRIDGHAALANGEALRRAGIRDTLTMNGGELLRREDGSLTGVLIDNAVELVQRVVPAPNDEVTRKALLTAQANCVEAGLTSVTDAGLLKKDIDAIDKLHKSGELKLRVYAMLSDSAPNYTHYLASGPYITDRLIVRSFKFYGDGALGSRGACLLNDYSDLPGHRGFLLRTRKHYEEKFRKVAAKGFQVNTHCIGDSAARMTLRLYASLLEDTLLVKDKAAQRWRIEHAQVVQPADLHWFKDYGIIPSMQPTHATSDMYWAADRLGDVRVRWAYALNALRKSAGTVALGTDFPVEQISPWLTLHAAVVRTDAKGFPAGGYQKENALSRTDALLGMTRWAAYAEFAENEKGSIAAGRFADFIIIDTDPMTCPESKLAGIQVLATYIQGQKVYQRK